MAVFVGAFMSPLGISGIQELAGKQHWFNFIILTGINFSMDMVILLTGVRMMCGELTGAFKGIQEKLVPNAVPAIDVAAMLPFSPNAATLGFIFTTIGTVLAMLILLATHSTVMVYLDLHLYSSVVVLLVSSQNKIWWSKIYHRMLYIIRFHSDIWYYLGNPLNDVSTRCRLVWYV